MKLWDCGITRCGVYKKKYTLRALFQSVAFCGLIAVFALYDAFAADESEGPRRLRALENSTPRADPEWLTVFYSIGVLYMFLALAIVCDEFFVPALEEMSSGRRLNLSMDVAGATLMAAGGSAPELFSSLFGTFQESDIGFGTIVGSAVFNVLFVIAMCALFAKETLELSWWPLFRDSFCYAIGLVVLAVFVGVQTKEKIVLWEACVLFSLYFLYILLMWKNAQIYKFLTGKELVHPEDEEDDSVANDATTSESKELKEEEAEDVENQEAPPSQDAQSNGSSNRSRSQSFLSQSSMDTWHRAFLKNTNFDFRWQGTFRAGILKLLRDPHSWTETGGVGIVAKMDGDADQVFRTIDEDGNGELDKDELRKLFDSLGYSVSESALDEVFAALDTHKTGTISEEEFHKWYTTSEELIKSQVRHVFDSLDVDKSGTIDKQELKALLIQLDPLVSDEDVAAAIEEMYQHGSTEEITFEEFSAWYEKSIIFERQRQRVEEDMQGAWESLKPPYGEGFLTWLQFIIVFPLVLVMALTIPDVRIPGRSKWCYVSFVLSILWIGAFSYLMVDWAEIIGNTAGIPSVVMGYTVLAAGTSVPDLLSSVIVARRGSGDMAVSSSIGSNIFDILVGLPVPWILYTLWPSTKSSVYICSSHIFTSLFILLGMLVFVILAVHCQGWKLTKPLGGMMILFYIGFLVQAILLGEECEI